jgi:hypothetical protein
MIRDNVRAMLNRGEVVAAKLPRLRPGFHAWIGINPFKVDPEGGTYRSIDSRPWQYRIRCFELRSDFDTDSYDVHEEDIEIWYDCKFESTAALEAALGKLMDDPTLLAEPWRSDYPL